MADLAYNDRRSFLKSMGVAAGVAGAAGAATAPVLLSASPAAAVPLAAEVTSWGLEVGDAQVALLKSAQGGWPVAEIVEVQEGGELFARKHIGNVKWEDISVSMGIGQKASLYSMLSDAMQGDQQPFDGGVLALTTNFMPHSKMTFQSALITEISFPKMDAVSKEACKLTVKLSPESTSFTHSVKEKWSPIVNKAQKQWLPSNFRLEIDGLDCKRVSSIDSFTWKCAIVEEHSGGDAAPATKEPSKIEFPNIVITLTDPANDFFKWFVDATAPEAKSGDYEKQGKLTWLASNLRDTIGTVFFTNLGPVRIAHDDGGPGGGESTRRVKCELYCEEMALKFNAST